MTTTDRPRWYRRRPRTAIALFLCALFVSADLGLAFVVDHLDLGVEENFEGAVRLRRPDVYYHHGLVANGYAADANYRGHPYTFATNSLGFRDREVRAVSLTRPRGVRYRLLFLGDSFTEGLGVDWDSTLVGRVATAFAADSVEVLNAGVASYAPVLEERKVRDLMGRVGLEFDELALVLDESDPANERDYRHLDPLEDVSFDPRPFWRRRIGELGGHSFTYRTLREWYHATDERAAFAAFAPDTGETERWLEERAVRRADEGLALMRRGVDTIRTLLDARRIPITVTIYPWPFYEAEPVGAPRYFADYWRRWSAEQGVPLLDLLPAFLAAHQRLGASGMLNRLFFDGDIHWTPEGSGLAATAWLEGWCRVRAAVTPRACAAVAARARR